MNNTSNVLDAIAIGRRDFSDLLEKASFIGRIEGQVLAGVKSVFINQNKAYKLYGRGNVERWLNNGKINRYIDTGVSTTGTSYRYSIIELITCALASNCLRDLPKKVKEEYEELVKPEFR